MKRGHGPIDEVLHHFLRSTPVQEMEAAGARVLHRMRREAAGAVVEATHSPRGAWRILAAASAIAAVIVIAVVVRHLHQQSDWRAIVEDPGGGLYFVSGNSIQSRSAGDSIRARDVVR